MNKATPEARVIFPENYPNGRIYWGKFQDRWVIKQEGFVGTAPLVSKLNRTFVETSQMLPSPDILPEVVKTNKSALRQLWLEMDKIFQQGAVFFKSGKGPTLDLVEGQKQLFQYLPLELVLKKMAEAHIDYVTLTPSANIFKDTYPAYSSGTRDTLIITAPNLSNELDPQSNLPYWGFTERSGLMGNPKSWKDEKKSTVDLALANIATEITSKHKLPNLWIVSLKAAVHQRIGDYLKNPTIGPVDMGTIIDPQSVPYSVEKSLALIVSEELLPAPFSNAIRQELQYASEGGKFDPAKISPELYGVVDALRKYSQTPQVKGK